MLTRIAKEFRWEMAHRLPDHDGGCRNVHGHGYRMTVEIMGEPREDGMVLDYFEMTRIIDPMIEQIDHSFLCDGSDILMRDFLKSSGLKVVFVEFPTTAENIAGWFFDQLSDVFTPMKHLRNLRIRVSETERTFAEVSGELRIPPPDAVIYEHQAHMLE